MYKIKNDENGLWLFAKDYEGDAFKQFKHNGEEPLIYKKDDIEFTIKRNENGGIYLIDKEGLAKPFVDWDNVKIFLLDVYNVGWYSARNYQTWAYFDFVYSGDSERFYASKKSEKDDYVQLPYSALPGGIIFRMSRNENGTIFYEKDDEGRTKVRISDNDQYRSGYMGFYNRMTMDTGPIGPIDHIIPKFKKVKLPSNVVVSTTSDEDKICFICNINKQNIKFAPCNHIGTCSECYLKLESNLCPFCKTDISSIKAII